MLYIKASKNSPKIVINFDELLFEISGNSFLDEPLDFYQPVFQYIDANFYQVKHSIHQWEWGRQMPTLTLAFYLQYLGLQDTEMIRQIDWQFFQIKDFTTFVHWHYDRKDEESVEQANDVKNTFLNQVRLISSL